VRGGSRTLDSIGISGAWITPLEHFVLLRRRSRRSISRPRHSHRGGKGNASSRDRIDFKGRLKEGKLKPKNKKLLLQPKKTRERERERDRQTDRERDRERDRETESSWPSKPCRCNRLVLGVGRACGRERKRERGREREGERRDW